MSDEVSEQKRLDQSLALHIDSQSRERIWQTSRRTLDSARPGLVDGEALTVMVLGYVQSGKTTSMAALMALACDDGVDLVISLLGTTTLLLEQNASRLSSALGIQSRTDYKWTEIVNPSSKSDVRQIVDWLSKGRSVFIPLLKHAKRIDALRHVLEDERLAHRRILIIDDEADQASLNTQVRTAGESRVYEAILNLRRVCTHHAYVQFTATPYALLLLEKEDHLYPDVVQLLEPGTGYTGGKEFFIDSRSALVHPIPRGDEQGSQLPIGLPRSLRLALANFLVGAAHLLARDPMNAPISMLIHPHSKTSIQERYRFLLQNYFEDMRDVSEVSSEMADIDPDFVSQLDALEKRVGPIPSMDNLLTSLKRVIKEVHISLLNSTTEIEKVKWNESPVHVLIGGNKLDRGFTVEGLTVTYMNRTASEQVDTTEQRARAFGYRREYLPYCQFFASNRTIDLLTDVVRTEIDLRQEIEDALLRGESVREWSENVGLLLPEGSKPTRDAVVSAITVNQLGWHYIRRPSRDPEAIRHNRALIEKTGLFSAQVQNYGRLAFPTLELDRLSLLEQLIEPWSVPDFTPNWQRDHLLEVVTRTSRFIDKVIVVLMDVEIDGERRARQREWRDETGFVNIFQGRDNKRGTTGYGYPGDRAVGEDAFRKGDLMVQIHRVIAKGDPFATEYLIPAIFLGNKRLIRTAT